MPARNVMNPWDDEELDNQQALEALLGDDDPDAPTSSSMPVSDPVRAEESAPAAPAPRLGWNNLNLDAPTQTGRNRFEGYNDDRALAGTDEDSTKDALRRWLGGLDVNLRGQSKDDLDRYFESQLGSARNYGLDIRDVQGDKILLNTRERGPEWIDFVLGAGGADPRFGYISDFDTTQQLLPAETGLAGAAAGAAQAPAADTTPLTLPNTDQPSALDDILAEVEALAAGGPSPMDSRALMALLGV